MSQEIFVFQFPQPFPVFISTATSSTVDTDIMDVDGPSTSTKGSVPTPAIKSEKAKGKEAGRFAWLLWRSAYFTRTLSVRNKILVPFYWFLNCEFLAPVALLGL